MCSGARGVVWHSLARRVVDALERVERGEPEEQDERNLCGHRISDATRHRREVASIPGLLDGV